MTSRKLRWIAGILALTAMVGTLASLQAADGRRDRDGREGRGGASAEDLQRYDRNGNGKLDPDEEAAKRADEARAKREKEKKR